jgi:hypothetical protein
MAKAILGRGDDASHGAIDRNQRPGFRSVLMIRSSPWCTPS